MRYPGLDLFKEKLELMIYSYNNPFIKKYNHPSIISQSPQLQLLYEELDSKILTLLVYNIYRENKFLRMQSGSPATHPQKNKRGWFARYLWLRIGRYCLGQGFASEENKVELGETHPRIQEKNKFSLNLDYVIRSIKSIKEEYMNIDSFPRTDPMKKPSAAAAGTSCIINPLGTKKVLEDIVVGFDRHVELIRGKLAEDCKQLDVVSIVGMGGIGKTTLANKVFNDPFIVYHFHVRGWVTVSQKYEKRDLLIQILESTGVKQDIKGDSYPGLRGMLHKRLMGERYLIVIDDIWSTQSWDDLKLFFPSNHNGSRILLTSRLKEVALHAKSHGFIHELEFLTEGESWELLRKKVFHGSHDCPKSFIESGMQIAKNCHGLPVTLVVITGVLAKEAVRKDSWERIGQSVASYVVGEHMGYIEPLALSIHHLPGHLRDCFLYLGGFPEDYKFQVKSTIWLWVAEGFIQDDGIRSLEEIAEDYLMELVDRNLVVVAAKKSNGTIKSFYVHDLLRELCLEIATKERFYLKTHRLHSDPSNVTPYKQRRIFIEHDISIRIAPRIRSLLCLCHFTDIKDTISKWSNIWMLLMVLDLRNSELDHFPEEITLLVHLRYLGLPCCGYFPPSICNLFSLETLIFYGSHGILKLPNTISNLTNLKHLQCDMVILFPPIHKPMNLETISRVVLGYGAESLVKCFPRIKKLPCLLQQHLEYDFKSLTLLENLKLTKSVHVEGIFSTSKLKFQKDLRGFPASLKSLTLARCNLPWSDMSMIQSLPKLEVLRLRSNCFVGPRWDAGEEQFRQLKVLKLTQMGMTQWEVSDVNFPCLRQLVLDRCKELEEIPSEIGYVPTLEHISIYRCKDSVVESVYRIKKEQHDEGNFELKISVNGQLKVIRE